MNAANSNLFHITADQEPAWQQFALEELVCEVVHPFRCQLAAMGIGLSLDLREPQSVWADRQLLRRAVLELVRNAIDSMPTGGELVITSCQTHSGWELEIADSGTGLPGELQDRLFKSCETTRRKDAGLGLAEVFRVAELHRGSVTAMKCPEGGTAFNLQIPRLVLTKAAA